MRLIRIIDHTAGREFQFTRFRSDNVPLDSLNIETDQSGIILKVRITNGTIGDCTFNSDGNLLECLVWETEDAARNFSSWSRHYPQRTGKVPGDIEHGLPVFSQLRSEISDTYLRHLLGVFPAQETRIRFDDSIYESPIPPTPEYSNPVPLEIPEPVVAAAPELPPGRWNRMLLIGSAAIAFAGMVWLSHYLYQRARVMAITESPAVQNLLHVDLFPVRDLLGRDLKSSLKRITNDPFRRSAPSAQEAELKSGDHLQRFLDEIYLLPAEEQLQCFHRSVILSPRFGKRFKAEAFRRFVAGNLVRVMHYRSPDLSVIAYDYLANQVSKKFQIDVFVHYATAYRGAPVATEALFALLQLIEIQKRLIQLFFETRTIAEFCKVHVTNQNEPLRAYVVCAFYKQHERYSGVAFDRIVQQFDDLRSQVVSHMLETDEEGYRKADMHLVMAQLLFENHQYPGKLQAAMSHLQAIAPLRSDPTFTYSSVYQRMLPVLREYGDRIRNSMQIEAIQSELQSLEDREQALRSKLKLTQEKDPKFVHALEASWQPMHRKAIEELLKRESRLQLERNPENSEGRQR